MNIWLRILMTLGRSLFQSKIEPTAVLKTDMIVGLTEADVRLVSNARYLLFMEVGRLELMLRTGIFRHARRHGWLPLVVAQTIRYKSPLRRFQRFTLTTRLAGWDEKWFFVEHKIERRGRLMAFGLVKCCFKGKDGVVAPASALADLNVSSGTSVPGYAAAWMSSESELLEAVEEL